MGPASYRAALPRDREKDKGNDTRKMSLSQILAPRSFSMMSSISRLGNLLTNISRLHTHIL